MMRKFVFASLVLCAAFAAVHAEIVLPKIFSNNMVLQRGMPLKFWGRAEPGAEVELTFDGGRFKCRADAQGGWALAVPPRKADAEPKNIEFYENSKLSKTVKNVLVGEVWIAGGQSNMEYKLSKEEHGKASNAAADFPLIRVFMQNDRAVSLEPQWDSPRGAQWQVCSPNSAWRFSAVGFYFARTIFEDLKVPVGIVETPHSGSFMATWLAWGDLKDAECYEENILRYQKENANYDYAREMEKYREKIAEYKEKVEAAKSVGEDVKAIKRPGEPPLARGYIPSVPSISYNAKIAPLLGFAARGVVWYQGESDAKDSADTFAAKFELLVDSWRKYFANPDMAFCFVQLPSIGRDFWVPARLQQAEAAKKIKNAAMAVSIDLGEENDVHPKNKLDIGVRLGRLALLKFYGKKNIADFPSVKSVKFNKSDAYLEFAAPNSSIKISGEPRGFEVLSDGKWQLPNIASRNGKLRLSIPDGRIEAVRYLAKGWAAPDVCVFNSYGLPLGPFEFHAGR